MPQEREGHGRDRRPEPADLEAKLERAGVLDEMRKPRQDRDLPDPTPRPRRGTGEQPLPAAGG